MFAPLFAIRIILETSVPHGAKDILGAGQKRFLGVLINLTDLGAYGRGNYTLAISAHGRGHLPTLSERTAWDSHSPLSMRDSLVDAHGGLEAAGCGRNHRSTATDLRSSAPFTILDSER